MNQIDGVDQNPNIDVAGLYARFGGVVGRVGLFL